VRTAPAVQTPETSDQPAKREVSAGRPLNGAVWLRIASGAIIVAVSAASLAPSIAINAVHALNNGGHIPLLILAVMSVLAAPICLAALPRLLSRKRFDLAAGAGLLFCCSVAFNLSNAIGLAGGERDQQREDRSGQITKVSSARQRLLEVSTALIRSRTVARDATPAMVEAEVLGLKAHPLYTRSGECKNVTVAESRDQCQKLADALVREAAAREVVRLEGEAKELRAKLDGFGEAPSSADPKVDRIQAVVGLMLPVANTGGRWVGIALDLNVALLVELLGSFLPPIVGVLIWPWRREPPAPEAMPAAPTGLQVVPPPAKPTTATILKLVAPPDKPKRSRKPLTPEDRILQFVGEKLRPGEGEATFAEIGNALAAWWEENCKAVELPNRNMVAKVLTEKAHIEYTRRGGKSRYAASLIS
jgi:hypothetical protein